jgi:hypothetical protein
MQFTHPDDPNFDPMWEDLLSTSGYLDALYGPANIAFYREICGSSDAKNISLLVSENGMPICGLMAFRRTLEGGATEISCFGLPLLYAERFQAEASVLARAQRLLRDEIESLLQVQSGRAFIRYRDRLLGGYLSLAGRALLDLGAKATPHFSQIIDLSLPEEVIHKSLTKSYKWSVNWSQKNLTHKVLDSTSMTIDHIEDFRRLHFEAAGRETRSPESWKLQYEMVRTGEAFGVFAWMKHSLVSAALFSYSKSHCFYGVSASRRDLFDKPISHGVIWIGLLHAKNLGVRYFEMGEQLFPMAPRHYPSRKELGISFFKRAFGGRPLVFLDICLHLVDGSYVDASPSQ